MIKPINFSLDCILDGGYELKCRDASGGVIVVRLSDWKDRVYAFTGNIIEGTDAGDGAAQEFFTIEQLVETAEIVEAPQVDTTFGTSFFQTDLTIVLPNKGDKDLDDQVRNLYTALSKGKFLALVKDQNGIEKLYGIENGLRLTEGAGGLGKALTDLNGTTITLQAKEPNPARLANIPGGAGGSTAFIINPAPL
jgi:hypothetical protein